MTTTTDQLATDPTTPEPPTPDLTWDEVVAHSTEAGHGAYLATVGPDGRPHVAWVSLGHRPERLWFSTFRSSRKGRNLRHGGEVAVHWAQAPERLLFARAEVRVVEDRAESDALWDGGVLPYDLGGFFTGKDDPELQFVELRPTHVSLRRLDGTNPRVWAPT